MFKATLKWIVILAVWLVAPVQIAQASPLTTLETAATNVLNALKQNKANLKTNPNYVYSVVNRYIIPHVDVFGLARSVLGRTAWTNASISQKKAFTHAFTQLVVRTYSGALRDYSGERVRFLPLRGDYQNQRFIKVSSYIIRPNGQNIPLQYSMVKKRQGWKVYDMSVEGVSLLQSYRSQFSNFLRSGTLDQLIDKLKSKGN